MAYGTRVSFEAVREIAFGAVSGSYAAVGSALAESSRLISFNNGLDAAVYVSFDGVNDHLRVVANGFKLLDLTTNKVRDDGLFLARGSKIYIKQVSGAASAGDFWVETLYGDN